MATKTAETDKPWAKPRLNYRRGESREDAVVIIFASDGLDEQDIKSYTAGLWERYRERFRDRLVRFEPCAGDPQVIGTKIYDPLDPKTDQLTSRR